MFDVFFHSKNSNLFWTGMNDDNDKEQLHVFDAIVLFTVNSLTLHLNVNNKKAADVQYLEEEHFIWTVLYKAALLDCMCDSRCTSLL